MNRLLSLAAAIGLAAAAHAQTTHVVTVGPTFSFQPADLTIQVGDTVQWNWAGGFLHNVVSGAGGVPDGIFSSGAPVSGAVSFSQTFDAAFLTANPVPGDAYDYFCAVHISFGMTGVVRVTSPYGCTAPAGSLTQVSGAPKVGQTWTLGVDNPIPGGQTPGSLAFVGVATQPAPGFPCGLPVPGFHMDPTVATGELLISIAPPNPVVTLGPTAWTGPGNPASVGLPLPSNPSLVGANVYVQGLIFDPFGSNAFGAAGALHATIGG